MIRSRLLEAITDPIDGFRLAITRGSPPSVSGREGIRDLRVMMAAYTSMARGPTVSMAEDSP